MSKAKEFVTKIIEEELTMCFRDCSIDNVDKFTEIVERYHTEQLRLHDVGNMLKNKEKPHFIDWMKAMGYTKKKYNPWLINGKLAEGEDIVSKVKAYKNL